MTAAVEPADLDQGGPGLEPGPDEVRRLVRRFLDAHRPGPGDPERFDPFDYHEAGFDRSAWMAALGDAGLAAPTWPEAYGGRGWSQSTALAVSEALAEAHAPPHLDVIGLSIVGPMLLELADDEQRARWLPAISRGTAPWCQLFSEPGSGSDLGSMVTRARRSGDGYVVRGRKIWTSNAQHARWGLLITRLDDEGGSAVGERPTFVALAVDMSTPGVRVEPIAQMHGEASFSEVVLEDVVVSPGDRIGAEGEGWRVALSTLSYERAALGGTYFHLAGARQRLIHLLRARGDRPSAEAMRVLSRAFVHRLWVHRRAAASASPAQGMDWLPLKVMMSRLNQELTAELHRHGGAAGLLDETHGEVRAMLRSRGNSIEGGTTEVLKSTIAERILQLPKG